MLAQTDARPRPEGTAADPGTGTSRVALGMLLVVATVLRFVQIGSQPWLDEISALTGSIERPFSQIATRWPGAASHIFYEILARAGFLAFGSPIGIRLPAALFGVAGVAVIFAFANRAFGQRQAFVIGGLLAVSYDHVFFSQSARGYTLLIALYLGTLLLLVEAQRRGRASRALWWSYALAGAFAAYSMPMGWFILPGQGLVLIWMWWRARRNGLPPTVPSTLIGAAVTGGVLAALLYAPFVPGLMKFTKMNASTASEGPRAGLGLVREVVDGLVVAFHGPIGLAVVLAFGLAGVWTWWRRHPSSLFFAFAPLVLEAIGVVIAGIGIHPRYFAVALPVLIIVAGLGLDSIVELVANRLPVAPRTRATVRTGALAAVVLVSAWPLVTYYRYPKQDFLGAIAAVRDLRPACTVRVGVRTAGHVLGDYYHADYVTVNTLSDLRAIEAKGGRVCVVTTLEGLLAIAEPDLIAYLRQHYRRVMALPGTVGDAAMRIYEPTTT
ncbi:MAG: glycosyltransferase family 39 protein [Gemmatimonadaceae bacterium]